MTKKFLILMLVLGMTSLANAGLLGLTATVDGEDYNLDGTGAVLDIGVQVDISVIQDAPDIAGGGGEIFVSFTGTGSGIDDTTPVAVFDPVAGTLYGWAWLFNGGVSMIDNSDSTFTAWKGAAGNVGVGTPGAGSLMDVIQGTLYSSTYEFSLLTTETTPLMFSGTWDGSSGNLNDILGGTINVVPEPMTIILLGLGGLFLRRRR